MWIRFDSTDPHWCSYYCVNCEIYDSTLMDGSEGFFDEDRYFGDSAEGYLGHVLLHRLAGDTIPSEVLDELQKIIKEEGLCQKPGTELASKLNTLMLTRKAIKI